MAGTQSSLGAYAGGARGSSLAVLKVGGSVLAGAGTYRTVARAVAGRLHQEPGTRLLVVVSAELGTTDALLAAARDLEEQPDAALLDLLWSTGELRATALLALALKGEGVRATSANVHQAGLVATADGATLRPLRLLALLAGADVVVTPGFLARGDGDAIVSLGRGGSDLSAVLLAAGLGAGCCELIKDVPGYFTADPRLSADSAHIPALTYDAALSLAEAGCPLVQRAAIAAARDAGLRLVVRTLGDARSTEVFSNI